jgi:hypothetical protein
MLTVGKIEQLTTNSIPMITQIPTSSCTGPSECSLFLVICDGKPCAAYPRRLQAEVYASGFSKPVEIVAGIFTANAALRDAEGVPSNGVVGGKVGT